MPTYLCAELHYSATLRWVLHVKLVIVEQHRYMQLGKNRLVATAACVHGQRCVEVG